MNTIEYMKRSLIWGIVLMITISCQNNPPEGFLILPISEKLAQEMRIKNVFDDRSPVSVDRLRLIRLRYIDFDDQDQEGEIVVLDACAQQVQQIFIELYQKRFALAQVKLLTAYNGSDSLSMLANNTSGHNFRAIAGTERLSLHSYGTAIDINPVNNPLVDIPCEDSLGIAQFEPITGIKYANRMENRLGKTNRQGMAEAAVEVFARNGFYWWGGYWNCPIDYQHFQLSRSVSELLAIMESEEAILFFKILQEYYNDHQQPIEDALEAKIGETVDFKDAYLQDPEGFIQMVGKL